MDWTKDNSLSDDIFPWICSWFYFYDQWLQTGKWLGPEAKH